MKTNNNYEIELSGDLVLENERRKIYFKKIGLPEDFGAENPKDFDSIIFLSVAKGKEVGINTLSKEDAKKLGEFLIEFANG